MPLRSIAARAARDPFDRLGEVEERVGGVAGGILDRQAGDPGGGRGGDILRDGFRHRREAALEVGINGNRDAAGDCPEVAQDLVEGHVVVRPAQRPGEARAGGGERRETELGQEAGAADVPGVGDDEAA